MSEYNCASDIRTPSSPARPDRRASHEIAVIGTGLIGSQVIRELTAAGHDATGHSRSTGVDLISGDGFDDAARGAEVFPLDELGRVTLAATGDNRHVVTDETAGMFAAVKGGVLTTPEGATSPPLASATGCGRAETGGRYAERAP
jgi:3-hydroxyisobutyrate dehydrogenase-like beta-hydroxyacid dehydrogenase